MTLKHIKTYFSTPGRKGVLFVLKNSPNAFFCKVEKNEKLLELVVQ